MRQEIVNHIKKGFSILLALGALAGGVLAVIQLADFVRKEKIVIYDEHDIPLVSRGAEEFRRFLNENEGNKVKFDTNISFLAMSALNKLIHERCNYDPFMDAVRYKPEMVKSSRIGLVKFKKGFVDPQKHFFYNDEEKRYDFGLSSVRNISCYDSIRIVMKEPSRLRFSHGGPGITYLPFSGTFIVEVRYFSGPSIEYTLREI